MTDTQDIRVVRKNNVFKILRSSSTRAPSLNSTFMLLSDFLNVPTEELLHQSPQGDDKVQLCAAKGIPTGSERLIYYYLLAYAFQEQTKSFQVIIDDDFYDKLGITSKRRNEQWVHKALTRIFHLQKTYYKNNQWINFRFLDQLEFSTHEGVSIVINQTCFELISSLKINFDFNRQILQHFKQQPGLLDLYFYLIICLSEWEEDKTFLQVPLNDLKNHLINFKSRSMSQFRYEIKKQFHKLSELISDKILKNHILPISIEGDFVIIQHRYFVRKDEISNDVVIENNNLVMYLESISSENIRGDEKNHLHFLIRAGHTQENIARAIDHLNRRGNNYGHPIKQKAKYLAKRAMKQTSEFLDSPLH